MSHRNSYGSQADEEASLGDDHSVASADRSVASNDSGKSWTGLGLRSRGRKFRSKLKTKIRRGGEGRPQGDDPDRARDPLVTIPSGRRLLADAGEGDAPGEGGDPGALLDATPPRRNPVTRMRRDEGADTARNLSEGVVYYSSRGSDADEKDPRALSEGRRATVGEAGDRFESRLRAKEAAYHRGGNDARGAATAEDQFESRLRAKAMRNSPSGDAAASRQFEIEGRLQAKAMKTNPSVDDAATSRHTHHGMVGAHAGTAEDLFESRLRAKAMENNPSVDNAATSRHTYQGRVGAHAGTAGDQYESRLKAKQGDVRSPLVAATHNGTVGARASTAEDQFESRLRAKAMQRNPSVDDAANSRHTLDGTVGARASTAEDQFERRLRAKAMQSNPSVENAATSRHTLDGTVGARTSTSEDQFESRLRAKAMQNNPSMDNAATSRHTYQGMVGAQDSTAEDQFESRLRAKAMQNNPSVNDAASSRHTHQGMVGARAGTAEDQFESRLRAKAMQNNPSMDKAITSRHTYEGMAGAHTATADDQFESRPRAKAMQNDGAANSAADSPTKMEGEESESSNLVVTLLNMGFDKEQVEKAVEALRKAGATEIDEDAVIGAIMCETDDLIAHDEKVGAQAATAEDQFESKRQAKAMQTNPSVDNAATSRHTHQGMVGAHAATADDQFESRLRAKAMQHNPSVDQTATSRHTHQGMVGAHAATVEDQFESRLRAKAMQNNPSVDNAATSRHTHQGVVGAHAGTAEDQFESRLRAKAMQSNPSVDNAATSRHTHQGMVGAHAGTAEDQFESRLRAKAMQNIPSVDNAATSRHVGALAGSAGDQYESRLKAKVMKNSPSIEKAANAHHGTVGAHASTADDQFESRLRAKAMQNNPSVVTEATSRHVGAMAGTAGDPYESRLKAKAMKDSPSLGSAAVAHRGLVGAQAGTAEDEFERRLRAKAMQKSPPAEMAAAHHKAVGGTASKAEDQYETELKAKAAKSRTSMEISANASAGYHRTSTSSSASDDYEQHIRAKMERNSMQSKRSSSASDDYEQCVGAKMDRNSMQSKRSSSASDDYEQRVRAKMERNSMQSKRSSSASDDYEQCVSAKMERNSLQSQRSSSASNDYKQRVSAKMERNSLQSQRSSSASDDYGQCVGAKMDRNSMQSQRSSSASDDYEQRVRAKMERNSLQSKHSTSTDGIAAAGERTSGTPLSLTHDDQTKGKIEFDNDRDQELNHSYSMDVATIEKYADSPAIITTILEQLGESSLSSEHGITDGTNNRKAAMELKSDWVCATATAMNNHISDVSVQLAALKSILSVVALDSKHAAKFTSYGLLGLEPTLSAMKTHRNDQQLQEYGSGIVACLASDKDRAIHLSSVRNGAVVERLGDALFSHSESALKALYRLLVASQQSGHIIETIGRCNNRGSRGEHMLTNAMEATLGIIRDCPSRPGVQIWGLRLLWALFSEERLPSGSLSALIRNVLLHLEATIASQQLPQAVHESAICLLSRISCCNDAILEGTEQCFSRVAVEIILARPKSRTVAMHGCHCIGNVLHIQDNTSSVLSAVINDFEEEEVAEIAINSIAILTKRGFSSIVALLNNDKLIHSIAGCMERHAHSSSIQIAGCDILSTIALERHIMHEICSSGGASRIISALYNLSEDGLAVCKALQALSNIIGICAAEVLQKSRAPASVLKAMEANMPSSPGSINPMDVCIQIRGATTLWNLVSCHPCLQTEIIQLGGIQTLSKGMRNLTASQHMQEKGIIALWSLTVSASLEPTVRSDAIEAITDAVAAHSTSAKICEHGLGALSSLATKRSSVKDVENVIDLIFSCMRINTRNAGMQQGALAALSKISIDQSENQVLKITSADLDVITTSMRTHVSVKGVQENALILLRSYAFSSANVDVMGQNPYLVGLTKTAVSNFGRSLRVCFEDLLHVLPSDSQ